MILFRLRIGQKAASRCNTIRMMSTSEVITEEVKNTGIITINRPKALNALTLDCIRKIDSTLKKWENTKSLVIMKGAGEKAFCAGGDVKSLVLSEDKTFGQRFMREQYTLDHLIATYRIPNVALINGITMGGGVGLAHGKFSVATEKTLVAMPETAIGLFPDVGASYILSRLKGKLGAYLALPGIRVKGKDVLACGLSTHYCDSSKLPELENALVDCKSDSEVECVLNKFCINNTPEFSLEKDLSKINSCFSAPTVEGIVENLKKDNSDWAKQILTTLSKMCPQSLKIAYEEIRRAEKMTRKECFEMEYRLVHRLIIDYNFSEGVRSLLIDKTNNPQWKPDKLEDINDGHVNTFFERLPDDLEIKLRSVTDSSCKL